MFIRQRPYILLYNRAMDVDAARIIMHVYDNSIWIWSILLTVCSLCGIQNPTTLFSILQIPVLPFKLNSAPTAILIVKLLSTLATPCGGIVN